MLVDHMVGESVLVPELLTAQVARLALPVLLEVVLRELLEGGEHLAADPARSRGVHLVGTPHMS